MGKKCKQQLLLILTLISMSAFSQQKSLKILNLKPQSEDFIFPSVSYSEKSFKENKINSFLQVNELEYISKSGQNSYHLASAATNSYQNYLYSYG